jgi:hypothetical protein
MKLTIMGTIQENSKSSAKQNINIVWKKNVATSIIRKRITLKKGQNGENKKKKSWRRKNLKWEGLNKGSGRH